MDPDSTRWSLVADACASRSDVASGAMAELCESYWSPLYAYARRCGYGVQDAEELTQGFFAHLLEKQLLKLADPARGKFRNFLLTSYQNFINGQWHKGQAKKRGGERTITSLDALQAERQLVSELGQTMTPEALYQRNWALSLLETVFRRLKAEHNTKGKLERFELLKEFLTTDQERASYGEIADRLSTSEGSVRTAVHRLRKRYGQLLREEISRTIAPDDDVADELDALFAALSGNSG